MKVLRELPFMTSALEGGPGKADKVREFSKGGCVKMRTREGGQEIGNISDVINGKPQGKRKIHCCPDEIFGKRGYFL